MAVTTLKWDQVNAWRLSQHGLAPRLEQGKAVQAAQRACGIQAQVMSAAELALGVRTEALTPAGVQSALWRERTLVKTWAMRATLHLFAASDLPLYAAARSVHDVYNWRKYFDFFGISQPDAVIAAVPQVLGSEPMRREQLASALAVHLGAPDLEKQLLASSWGSLWKPSAWRGDLCFGPNQGQNVTFVNPHHWLGTWQSHEPYPALQEVARRYLRAYGPATPKEFALWWGMGLVPARKLFQSLGDELETVEVEGWQASALRSALEPMQKLELPGVVNLLPLFDAYVMGLARGPDLAPILPEAYYKLVFRPQGWITAVVLVDGYIKGTWEHKKQGAQAVVKVRMFEPPTGPIRRGIAAEAVRIGEFLGTQVQLLFE